MPYCGPNCHLLASPVGAAAIQENRNNQHFCQNCPNLVSFSNHALCRDCAQTGSFEYAYHHQHCMRI